MPKDIWASGRGVQFTQQQVYVYSGTLDYGAAVKQPLFARATHTAAARQ